VCRGARGRLRQPQAGKAGQWSGGSKPSCPDPRPRWRALYTGTRSVPAKARCLAMGVPQVGRPAAPASISPSAYSPASHEDDALRMNNDIHAPFRQSNQQGRLDDFEPPCSLASAESPISCGPSSTSEAQASSGVTCGKRSMSVQRKRPPEASESRESRGVRCRREEARACIERSHCAGRCRSE